MLMLDAPHVSKLIKALDQAGYTEEEVGEIDVKSLKTLRDISKLKKSSEVSFQAIQTYGNE